MTDTEKYWMLRDRYMRWFILGLINQKELSERISKLQDLMWRTNIVHSNAIRKYSN